MEEYQAGSSSIIFSLVPVKCECALDEAGNNACYGQRVASILLINLGMNPVTVSPLDIFYLRAAYTVEAFQRLYCKDII